MSTLGIVYIVAGVACVVYYFTISLFSRFGLSISWIWPALGATFIAVGLLTRAPLPQWLRWVWRALLCGGLAVVVALECLVVGAMNTSAPPNMEYLIVLGARVYDDGPSPALTRRVNAVMAHLDEHPDAIIIASGGQGTNEPISEAQCIRDELVKRGVDPGRIWMEDQSTDTMENIANCKAMIGDDGAAIALVTNNYHMWRSLRIARKVGLTNVHGIAATYTGPTLFHYMIREAVSITVHFLRGDL